MKRLALFLSLFFLVSALTAQTERKIALIIGNSNYVGDNTLKNPVNDANLMAATLTQLGFTVIKKTDVNRQQMTAAVSDFWSKLGQYNVALFYYAGHGVALNGENYLLPVDAEMNDAASVELNAISLNSIVGKFDKYPNNTNILILDACRNNPFKEKRGTDRGFKSVNPSKGTYIAFAASEGEFASDNPKGNNGLFTEKLVEQMKQPVMIEQVFKRTRTKVQAASNNEQNPMEWSLLNGDFYFMKPTGTQQNTNLTTTTTTVNEEPENIKITKTKVKEKVKLTSEISGTLYIDDTKSDAIAPGDELNFDLNIGEHTIEIRGENTWTQSFTLTKGNPENLIAKSTKKKTTTTTTNTTKANDQPDRFVDTRDNHVYKLVVIGNQTWMAENLAFKASGGCWAYDNNQSNVEKYGYLYNWETAKNACPAGWHLPTDEEWKQLEKYLGMSESEANQADAWRGDGVGTQLKSTSGWYNSGNGSNSSGFNALPSGYRLTDGTFYLVTYSTYFWSSSPDGQYAWKRSLNYGYSKVYRGSYDPAYGFSVRCLRD